MHPKEDDEEEEEAEEEDDGLLFLHEIMRSAGHEGLVSVVTDLVEQKKLNLAKAHALIFCEMDVEKVSVDL
jgi:hypothetical protein